MKFRLPYYKCEHCDHYGYDDTGHWRRVQGRSWIKLCTPCVLKEKGTIYDEVRTKEDPEDESETEDSKAG